MGEMKMLHTQKEFMDAISNEFYFSFALHKAILDSYCYRDHRARDLIAHFKSKIERYGLKFSKCHHANGIGNNNEYTIFVENKDENGFIIQKNVAAFYYCFGIYGGCYVCLTDLSSNKKVTMGRAL
jgi:hypothetical protein